MALGEAYTRLAANVSRPSSEAQATERTKPRQARPLAMAAPRGCRREN